jgi:O-antigen ligase
MSASISLLKHRFYPGEILLLVFGYLITEGIFSWIFIHNSGIILLYQKIISIFSFGFILWRFRDLKPTEKLLIGLFTILVIKLVFESLWKYDTLFKQFTIFTVIYPAVFVVFIKYILRRLDIDVLEFVARFYLVLYIAFMLLYGSGFSFSLQQIEMEDYGPFSGDTRIIHARSVYMLILPLLWFLNAFLEKKKFSALIAVLLCLTAIIIHQHRSVWACAILSLFLYIWLFMRSGENSGGDLAGVFGLCAIGLICSWFIISELKPELLTYLGSRFDEIFSPASEGSTGNFRIDQSLVYGRYIEEKPLLGWSFQGFMLPNPLVDWWDENTGHHFHQGFIEILFYHGIIGLMLKYGFLFYILIKAFRMKLSPALCVLIPFCITGLLFSMNYILPLIFWGHTGMCLFYMEENEQTYDLYSNTST